MKQIKLLTIAVLVIATTSHAQINKGSMALGGNIYFNSERSKYDNGAKVKTTSFSISPSLLISYNNNKAVGFSITYNHSKYSVLDQKSNTYGAGLFFRQYKPLGKGFYVFAQEALNFTYGKSNSLNDTVLVENKTSSVSFTANPGLAYDISKRFQLELLFFNNLLSAAYSHHILSGTSLSTIKSDDFNIGANLDGSQFSTLNLGAKIFFGR